jgi:hypothetical protein
MHPIYHFLCPPNATLCFQHGVGEQIFFAASSDEDKSDDDCGSKESEEFSQNESFVEEEGSDNDNKSFILSDEFSQRSSDESAPETSDDEGTVTRGIYNPRRSAVQVCASKLCLPFLFSPDCRFDNHPQTFDEIVESVTLDSNPRLRDTLVGSFILLLSHSHCYMLLREATTVL